MKQVANDVVADLENICVDPTEIRNLLLNDEKFSITEVPSVLILYSSGQHRVYTGINLDKWFEQLLQNIHQYQEQQQQSQQHTQISVDPIQPINENVPKPLRRKPGGSGNIPTNLPSPGREKISGETNTDVVSGAQAAIQEHIRQPEPDIPIDLQPSSVPVPHEVKSDGLSAKEIAKQMEDQREEFDDQIEQHRPFL